MVSWAFLSRQLVSYLKTAVAINCTEQYYAVCTGSVLDFHHFLPSCYSLDTSSERGLGNEHKMAEEEVKFPRIISYTEMTVN